jgi:hypothetical protein
MKLVTSLYLHIFCMKAAENLQIKNLRYNIPHHN